MANGDSAWGSWELTAVNQDAVHDPPLATLRYSNLESVLQRVRTTLSRHEEHIKKPAWLDSLQRQIDTVQSNVDVLTTAIAKEAAQACDTTADERNCAPSATRQHATNAAIDSLLPSLAPNSSCNRTTPSASSSSHVAEHSNPSDSSDSSVAERTNVGMPEEQVNFVRLLRLKVEQLENRASLGRLDNAALEDQIAAALARIETLELKKQAELEAERKIEQRVQEAIAQMGHSVDLERQKWLQQCEERVERALSTFIEARDQLKEQMRVRTRALQGDIDQHVATLHAKNLALEKRLEGQEQAHKKLAGTVDTLSTLVESINLRTTRIEDDIGGRLGAAEQLLSELRSSSRAMEGVSMERDRRLSVVEQKCAQNSDTLDIHESLLRVMKDKLGVVCDEAGAIDKRRRDEFAALVRDRIAEAQRVREMVESKICARLDDAETRLDAEEAQIQSTAKSIGKLEDETHALERKLDDQGTRLDSALGKSMAVVRTAVRRQSLRMDEALGYQERFVDNALENDNSCSSEMGAEDDAMGSNIETTAAARHQPRRDSMSMGWVTVMQNELQDRVKRLVNAVEAINGDEGEQRIRRVVKQHPWLVALDARVEQSEGKLSTAERGLAQNCKDIASLDERADAQAQRFDSDLATARSECAREVDVARTDVEKQMDAGFHEQGNALRKLDTACEQMGDGLQAHSSQIGALEVTLDKIEGEYMDTIQKLLDRTSVKGMREMLVQHAKKLRCSYDKYEELVLSKGKSFDRPAQQLVAERAQQAAQIIAKLADYSFISHCLSDSDGFYMVEPPETERIREMERFVTDVFKGLMPMPSNTPALTVDAQRTFETKLRKAIEIALSKYQPVKVPDSLFSKKQLLPSCAACGRATLQQPREQASADAGPEDEPQAPAIPVLNGQHSPRRNRVDSSTASPTASSSMQGGGDTTEINAGTSSHRYKRIAGFKMPKASSAPVLPKGLAPVGVTAGMNSINIGGRATNTSASVQRNVALKSHSQSQRLPLATLGEGQGHDSEVSGAVAAYAAQDKGNRVRARDSTARGAPGWHAARPQSASARIGQANRPLVGSMIRQGKHVNG